MNTNIHDVDVNKKNSELNFNEVATGIHRTVNFSALVFYCISYYQIKKGSFEFKWLGIDKLINKIDENIIKIALNYMRKVRMYDLFQFFSEIRSLGEKQIINDILKRLYGQNVIDLSSSKKFLVEALSVITDKEFKKIMSIIIEEKRKSNLRETYRVLEIK